MINLNNKFIYENNYNRSNRSFNKSNIYFTSSSNNTSNNSINILKDNNNNNNLNNRNSFNINKRKCIRDVDYESRFFLSTTFNKYKKDTIVKFNDNNNNKQNNYYCFCGDSNYSIDNINNNNNNNMNKKQKFSLKNKDTNLLQAPFDQSTTASFISNYFHKNISFFVHFCPTYQTRVLSLTLFWSYNS
jgi:hypothetical protein